MEKYIKKYPCIKCKHYDGNKCVNPEQKHPVAKKGDFNANEFSCLKFEEYPT